MKTRRTVFGDPNGSCRLCLGQSPLCRSHILPEFCYADLYDDKGRAVITGVDLNESEHVQKGLREFLLCAQCEQRIGRWERTFKTQWHDAVRVTDQDIETGVRRFSGLDYRQLKLFILSVFWRASVAQSASFKETNLGPYEEQLRQVLLSGDAGAHEDFTVNANLITHEGQILTQMISTPRRAKLTHITVYYCMFSGAEWYLNVCLGLDQHPAEHQLNTCLKEDGTLSCLVRSVHGSMTYGKSVKAEVARRTRKQRR